MTLQNLVDQGKDIIPEEPSTQDAHNTQETSGQAETQSAQEANQNIRSIEALALQKKKAIAFVGLSKDICIKHFRRYCQDHAHATVASFGEAPTGKMIAQYISTGEVDVELNSYLSPIHNRVINLNKFANFIRDYFPCGVGENDVFEYLNSTKLFSIQDGAVPKALRAVVNGMDIWDLHGGQEAAAHRDSILRIFGPCPSSAHTMERGVKLASYVSSTGRKEKNRSIWSIAGNGMATGSNNEEEEDMAFTNDVPDGIFVPHWLYAMNNDPNETQETPKATYRGPKRTLAIFNKASEIHALIEAMDNSTSRERCDEIKTSLTKSDAQFKHTMEKESIAKFKEKLNSNNHLKSNARQRRKGYHFAPAVTGLVTFANLRAAKHTEALRQELACRGIPSTVADIKNFKALVTKLKEAVSSDQFKNLNDNMRKQLTGWFDQKLRPKVFTPKSTADFSIPEK